MNEIVKVFKNSPVRIFDENGVQWFVGIDVCRLLGYTNHHKAIGDHCKGVTKRYPLQTAGGTQLVRVISEGDVMRLICGSKLPEAAKFERWVFDEVLPSIRNTGSYSGNAGLDTERLIAAIERQAEENARLRTENGLLRLFQPIGQPGDVSNRTGREKWKFRRGCFVSGKNGRSTSVFLIVQPELPLFLERQIMRREG